MGLTWAIVQVLAVTTLIAYACVYVGSERRFSTPELEELDMQEQAKYLKEVRLRKQSVGRFK